MAVPAGPTEQRYVGNGVTTIFPVPFLVIQASDLAVYVDGVKLTSGYSQAGVGNPTSTVTFTTAPANLSQILFTLEVPFERLNDYQENGDFLASTVNNDYDRIWQALKQLLRYSDRSLRLGQFDVDGQGWYRAKGNGIRDLRDPLQPQDAATMNWVDQFVADTLAAITGPVNNSANIFYQYPDGSAHVVQDLSGANGAFGIGLGQTTLGALVSDTANIRLYGAVADGLSHPLSVRFGTLAEAQAVYPHAVSLTDEIDWAAWQAAANTGKPVKVVGTPKINRTITYPSTGMFAFADPGTVVDARGAFTGQAVLSGAGSLIALPALSVNVLAGATTLTFGSAHGLQVGDYVCIWNPDGNSYSSWRTNYFAGEFVRVDGVLSSTSVQLAGSTYSPYAFAAVNVYKLTPYPSLLTNMTILSEQAVNGVHVDMSSFLRWRNVNATIIGNAALLVQRSVDGELIECSAFNVGTGGDDYGLSIANSQNMRTKGGRFHARRHGVAHGGGAGAGSVPCRNSYVIGATISNDLSSGTHAADFHGNSEDCWFIDCDIQGGGTWQGKNNGYRGGRMTSISVGCCLLASEIKGGIFTLEDVELICVGNPQATGRGVIDIGGNSTAISASTVERVLLRMINCTLNGRDLTSSSYVMRMTNRGSAVSIDFDINGLDMNVASLGAVLTTSNASGTALSNGISILNLSGNAPIGTQLHNASDAAYRDFLHRLPRQAGRQTLTTSTSSPSVTGSTVTFRYAYPRVPCGGARVANRGYIGAVAPIADAQTLSATTLIPVVRTPGATNFSAAVTIDVSYDAEICEY